MEIFDNLIKNIAWQGGIETIGVTSPNLSICLSIYLRLPLCLSLLLCLSISVSVSPIYVFFSLLLSVFSVSHMYQLCLLPSPLFFFSAFLNLFLCISFFLNGSFFAVPFSFSLSFFLSHFFCLYSLFLTRSGIYLPIILTQLV